jgi:hypothetical protein
VIKNIRAVIAQVADWVVAVVGVIKRTNTQARKSIKIQHLFEITNTIGCQVQDAEGDQAIETDANIFDMVAGKVDDF